MGCKYFCIIIECINEKHENHISIADSANDPEARDIPDRAAAGPQEAAGPQGGVRRQERLDDAHRSLT